MKKLQEKKKKEQDEELKKSKVDAEVIKEKYSNEPLLPGTISDEAIIVPEMYEMKSNDTDGMTPFSTRESAEIRRRRAIEAAERRRQGNLSSPSLDSSQ